MHLLISNHETEISAFQRLLGGAANDVEVVENNLSALSLMGSSPDLAQTLTVTEYQDEGVNVDTRTFVRNLAARALDSLEIVIVGQLFSDLSSTRIHVVNTIDEAAALVLELTQLQPAARAETAKPASNGHARYAAEETAVVTQLGDDELEPAVEQVSPSQARQAEKIVTPPKPRATRPWSRPEERVERELAPEPPAQPMENELDNMPATTRSLADDIRDWTERTERDRGKQRATPAQRRGLGAIINEMLPSTKRARAEEAELDKQIRSPRLTRCNSIAVISPKGGVGKSFLTYVVGNFLAEVRGDKVVAIDTNPDFGTLADQVRGREPQTISTLLEQLEGIKHYSDLRRFTSKVESRLEVLAAPADPDVMASISARDYGRVHEQLHHYYDTILFDCGTGFRDDITRFALQQCDQIVLVSAPLFITTGIVIRALGYLNQIGCDLSRVTLAINQVRREKPLDLNYMRERFGSRLNAIVEIPFDMQLYREMDTGEFGVDRTEAATRTSIKRLCAELVKHYE